MAIVPDDKNWTWVLETVCPECGFDAAAVELAEMGELVRANAALWPGLLAAADAAKRPTDHQWSALEYGCHVRDVFRKFDERLRLMLAEDGPDFENWDQDVTAIEDRYTEQDPTVVSVELVAAADAFAAVWDTVLPEHWERTGRRSDGSVFTIETFGRYFLHDPIHHLVDVVNGNAILRN
jgi:hypothetical protein